MTRFTGMAIARARRPLAALLLLLLALLAGRDALADPLPAGTYQETCRNNIASGGALTAECKNRGGDWRGTRLDNYRQCVGGIENHDGNLRCNRGQAPPGGTYAATCRDIWVEGNTLHAACQNRDGDWRDTVLANFQDCRGAISNQAGVLRCDRGGVVPAGPYQASCRDFWMEGSGLHASCKDIHGAWHDASVDTNGCARPIANIDGALSCPHGNAPGGSYLDSCRQISESGNRLTASCRTRSGSYVPASFDMTRRCVGGVYNVNGALTCVTGGNAPRGSYLDSCVDIDVTGNALSARCGARDGTWRRSTLANTAACTGIDNIDGQLTCAGAAAQAPPQNPLADQQVLCCSKPVPEGHILVDRKWNPAAGESCPTQSGSDVPNECFYARYNNKPLNARMRVCSSAPTPAGWERGTPYESATICPLGRVAPDPRNLVEITNKSAPVSSRAAALAPAERGNVQPDAATRMRRHIAPIRPTPPEAVPPNR